jgi:DNA-binding PadR family transcriptional regulator
MQSVKYTLMGLLAEAPRHGYELKGAFEELFGGSWPLNIGQVYTTLGRLERDGLVRSELVPQELVPDRKVYSLTDAGRTALDGWLREPSAAPVRLKDEVFAKVLVQGLLNGRDPTALIRAQRQAHMQTLAQLAALRRDDGLHATSRLLVEGAMLHVEADLRWLDICEERLGRRR